jgi:hypothetical protein
MQTPATIDEIITLTRSLSPLEKLKLIEHLTPGLEAAISSSAPAQRRRSLRGLWKNIEITDQDIADARREAWGGFPLLR